MNLKFINKCFFTVATILLLSIIFVPSAKANELIKKVDKYPMIAFANLEHSPFIQGDQNAIYMCSKNYLGEVQYQVLYMPESAKEQIWSVVNYKSITNGWTSSVQADEATIIDISDLKLNQGKYKFLIRVKRASDSKDIIFKNGNYDDEYITSIEVLDKTLFSLNEDVKLDKMEYTTENILNISKVKHMSYDVTHKLSLYSLANNVLLENESEYNDKTVNFKLDSLVQGDYIVILFSKYTATYNPTKVYEGWILKSINVNTLNKPTVLDLNSAIKKKIKADVDSVTTILTTNTTNTTTTTNTNADTNENKDYVLYTVEAKDTLYKIIRKFNNGVANGSQLQQLIELNNLKNADDIKVGQTLHIPKTWK